MRIIVLRDVTIFCVVDIDHRLGTTGLIYLLCVRKAKLSHKFRNGELIWIIRTLKHKKGLVTSQNKESVRYRGIFVIK
jgi:hypothetical protein